MIDLIVSNVQGWAPVTRLYANVVESGDYWLISVITVGVVRDAVADSLGIDLPPMPDIAETGHVEIYRATVDSAPRMGEWVTDDGCPPIEDAPDGAVGEIVDDHRGIIPVDGDIWATVHRDTDGEDLIIQAVDYDGDPLNGLTPEYVLPHGTSFAQALEHIQQEAS